MSLNILLFGSSDQREGHHFQPVAMLTYFEFAYCAAEKPSSRTSKAYWERRVSPGHARDTRRLLQKVMGGLVQNLHRDRLPLLESLALVSKKRTQ